MKPVTPTKNKCQALYGCKQQSQWCKSDQGKKCNRAQHPKVQETQYIKVTNAHNDSSKTASPHQDAATLTDKQVNTSHQPVIVPAPHLYLIILQLMTETNLSAQFKQYGPIKSVQMTENAVTSTNGVVVKMASIEYTELHLSLGQKK